MTEEVEYANIQLIGAKNEEKKMFIKCCLINWLKIRAILLCQIFKLINQQYVKIETMPWVLKTYRVFFLLVRPKKWLLIVKLNSKSHQSIFKCQNFLRLWHLVIFRVDQSKNPPCTNFVHNINRSDPRDSISVFFATSDCPLIVKCALQIFLPPLFISSFNSSLFS